MTQDEQIAAAYDFSSLHTIIALGAESASLFATIFRNHPHLMGVLFDQAGVLEAARAILATAGVEQHCDIIAGDFFEDVPLWGDLYLLAHMLCQWSDEQCIAVLSHCHQSMHPEGRVLVIEQVAPPEQGHFFAASNNGQIISSEQERTRQEQEYRVLFQATGLRLTQVLPTGSPYCILEAMTHKSEE